jgi:hypothetical protein
MRSIKVVVEMGQKAVGIRQGPSWKSACMKGIEDMMLDMKWCVQVDATHSVFPVDRTLSADTVETYWTCWKEPGCRLKDVLPVLVPQSSPRVRTWPRGAGEVEHQREPRGSVVEQ